MAMYKQTAITHYLNLTLELPYRSYFFIAHNIFMRSRFGILH